MTATAPDLHPLLRAVIAEPADDLVRLAVADWLEEHDESERAEFIRVEVDRAAWRVCPHGPGLHRPPGRCPVCDSRTAATARLRDLFFGGARDWFFVPGFGHPSYSADRVLQWYGEGDSRGVRDPVATGKTRRGFISEVRCSTPDLLAHAPALCRHPITRVVLTEKQPFELLDRWAWFVGYSQRSWTEVEYMVPTALAHRLPSLVHPTREAAADALSEACVDLLRQHAGVVGSTNPPRVCKESSESA